MNGIVKKILILAGVMSVLAVSGWGGRKGQGGTNHLNERPHTYWANEFGAIKYVPFDIFRPSFWGDERVEVWYRQNTFLYVRKDSHAYGAISSKNIAPLSSVAFMDCVHPAFYQGKLQQGVKQSLSMTIKACLLAIQRRLSPTKTGTFQS